MLIPIKYSIKLYTNKGMELLFIINIVPSNTEDVGETY